MSSVKSIELVPRSQATITAELELLARQFPSVRMVNIPVLLRFDRRSWEASALGQASLERAVPHLRAMDFPVEAAAQLASLLQGLGLREALLVRGDSPQDLARPVYSVTSAELIQAPKRAEPGLRLYAVFDPYRRGLRAGIEIAHEKITAGASGPFTQPFFDLRYLEICDDVLPQTDIFWGGSLQF